ncbi:hypothetical protein [Comamonas jiangduensis]|uniref:Uncharacterized protein n=1 Tax=Comamonas jiangduensis TaxID=1194168 RepID=A0ABV4IEF4_9BURK
MPVQSGLWAFVGWAKPLTTDGLNTRDTLELLDVVCGVRAARQGKDVGSSGHAALRMWHRKGFFYDF